MTIPRKRLSECPIERCISVVAGRWKAMILWQLFVEPQRYSQLEKRVDRVSQRALSQALSELARDGIIAKHADFWSLTPLGEAMRPALTAMFAWGSLHQDALSANSRLTSLPSSEDKTVVRIGRAV